MTDKIAKLLAKIPAKDLIKIIDVLEKVYKLELDSLNIKAIKGRTDIFRVRVGNYRIIFRIENKNVYVIAINRRNEKTYRDL